MVVVRPPTVADAVLALPPYTIGTSRLRHSMHDQTVLANMKKNISDNMLRISKTVVIRGIASIPQSKLNFSGYTSSLKLKTGRYEKVKNLVHNDVFFADGLSADENEVCGVGNDKRKYNIAASAIARMLRLSRRF